MISLKKLKINSIRNKRNFYLIKMYSHYKKDIWDFLRVKRLFKYKKALYNMLRGKRKFYNRILYQIYFGVRFIVKRYNYRSNLLFIKKRLKIFYGNLLDHYIGRLGKLVLRKKQDNVDRFFSIIERRIDVLLYRALYAYTVRFSRVFIYKRLVYVNNSLIKKVSIIIPIGVMIKILAYPMSSLFFQYGYSNKLISFRKKNFFYFYFYFYLLYLLKYGTYTLIKDKKIKKWRKRKKYEFHFAPFYLKYKQRLYWKKFYKFKKKKYRKYKYFKKTLASSYYFEKTKIIEIVKYFYLIIFNEKDVLMPFFFKKFNYNNKLLLYKNEKKWGLYSKKIKKYGLYKLFFVFLFKYILFLLNQKLKIKLVLKKYKRRIYISILLYYKKYIKYLKNLVKLIRKIKKFIKYLNKLYKIKKLKYIFLIKKLKKNKKRLRILFKYKKKLQKLIYLRIIKLFNLFKSLNKKQVIDILSFGFENEFKLKKILKKHFKYFIIKKKIGKKKKNFKIKKYKYYKTNFYKLRLYRAKRNLNLFLNSKFLFYIIRIFCIIKIFSRKKKVRNLNEFSFKYTYGIANFLIYRYRIKAMFYLLKPYIFKRINSKLITHKYVRIFKNKKFRHWTFSEKVLNFFKIKGFQPLVFLGYPSYLEINYKIHTFIIIKEIKMKEVFYPFGIDKSMFFFYFKNKGYF